MQAVQFFHQQQKTNRQWQLVLSAVVFVLALVSLGFGPAGWDWRLAVAWMMPDAFSQFSDIQINIVTQIRIPRFCMAMLIGAALAQSGAATQALCKNPLADPSIIGITAGAAAMAATLIAFAPKFGINPDVWVPYGAFVGALVVTSLVHQVSKRNNEVQVTTLILLGVAVNAICMAAIGLVSFYADDSSLRLITYWTMGSLAGANWQALMQALPLFLISMVGLYLKRKELNILLLGEAEARYLGINIKRLKNQIIVLVAVGVGAAVAISGMIGFIGLVVPHITRLIVGANMNNLLPLTFLTGALVLLIADWLARVLVSPAELPIGIITAVIGAPAFIYLLMKQQGKQND